MEKVHLLNNNSSGNANAQKLFVSTGHDGIRVSALINKQVMCAFDGFSCYDSALLEIGNGTGKYLLACAGPCL